jgi:poly-beta-hydroxyalkanoate depolymerase
VEPQSAICTPFLPGLQAIASFFAPSSNFSSALPDRQITAGCALFVRLCGRYAKPGLV